MKINPHQNQDMSMKKPMSRIEERTEKNISQSNSKFGQRESF